MSGSEGSGRFSARLPSRADQSRQEGFIDLPMDRVPRTVS